MQTGGMKVKQVDGLRLESGYVEWLSFLEAEGEDCQGAPLVTLWGPLWEQAPFIPPRWVPTDDRPQVPQTLPLRPQAAASKKRRRRAAAPPKGQQQPRQGGPRTRSNRPKWQPGAFPFMP